MPSILFHELIGNRFIKKYNKYNTPNFYLGLMVPDAVNAYGFASKEKRWKVHFRDSNLEQWKINILNFYKKNQNKYEETYLIGYLIHVLTDILCDEIYAKEIYPKLLEEGYNYDSAYSYYHDAIIKLENFNINEQWWKDVTIKIQEAEKIEINNMDNKMIQDWINYTLDKYENRKYENKGFISENFINKVLSEINEILEKEEII